MATQMEPLHFVLFPFMAQGHMIPMVDLARLLAQQGLIITIVTTPRNAARFRTTIDRAIESGLSIRLLEVRFPCMESGLPQGCENVEMLPSFTQAMNFFNAANKLHEPVQQLFEELSPRPSCIISDFLLTYTFDIANQFQIPRIVFHGVSCFARLLIYNVHKHSKNIGALTSDGHYFAVPNMPDKVELTKPQLPVVWDQGELTDFTNQALAIDQASSGVVINTFEELEPEYVKEYRKARGSKVWCIGPVSLCNKDAMDKADRGNKALVVDEHQCLRWLDSQETGSVVYACLGTVSNVPTALLIELGLGLEASNRPFIWVMRRNDATEEVEKWMVEDGFEERTKGRGLVIRGWAPQVLILSHPAIGGFLTHCGWNSTIEAIAEGVPLITWPQSGDQFCNEKVVVEILRIGVRVGVEEPLPWGDEAKLGVLVKMEDVKNAVEKLMEVGEESEERRKRAKKLGEVASKALEVGGSSHLNITGLIQDVMNKNL